MPYPYEPYPVGAADIRAAAEDTSGRLTSIGTLADQVEQEHSGIVSSVEGDLEGSVADAIDPMKQSATDVERTAWYAAGCLEFFAHAVDIFNTTGISPRSVSKLNSDWEALVANNFGVGHESLPSDATQAQVTAEQNRFSSAVGTARTGKAAEFDAEFARLEGNLDDAAAETQGKLNRGPNATDIKDLYSAGALPVFAALIWSDIDFSHQYLPPEKAQELADYVAEQVEKGDIDTDVVRLMTLYQDNADFSAEFYRQVTPEEMADAVEGMSDEAFPQSGLPNVDEEAAELYKDFLVAAGTMLGTYSRGVGDNRPRDDLAQQWADAITNEEQPGNASALSLLFKYGKGEFEGEFLGDLTSAVYEYERSKGGDPVWGPRGGWNESGGHDGALDPVFEDDFWMHSYGYDALSNLLSAMDTSPEAAQIFFGDADGTTEYDDTGAQINERLYYLLMERQWPADDGDGLGQALEGATIDARGNDEAGAQSATLASQLAHLIANEAGDDDDWHDDGWHIPEGMRDSVGNVTAAYISDVFRISQNDSGDPTDLADWVYGDDASENAYNDIYGLRASNSELATLLQEIGRGDDKSGITTVTTAALMHNNDLTSTYLETYNDEHPEAPLTIDDLRESGILGDLENQSSRTGTTLDFIVKNGIDGGHDQEADNAARQEVFSKAFSIATDLVPTPQGKIAGLLTSEGISWLNDQVSQVPDSVTDQWASDIDGQVERNLEYQTYNALVDNGYLDIEHDPEYGLPEGAVTYSNGHYVIDPTLYNTDPSDAPADMQNAFNDWQDGPDPNDPSDDRNGAPNDIFQDYLNALASRIAHH